MFSCRFVDVFTADGEYVLFEIPVGCIDFVAALIQGNKRFIVHEKLHFHADGRIAEICYFFALQFGRAAVGHDDFQLQRSVAVIYGNDVFPVRKTFRSRRFNGEYARFAVKSIKRAIERTIYDFQRISA